MTGLTGAEAAAGRVVTAFSLLPASPVLLPGVVGSSPQATEGRKRRKPQAIIFWSTSFIVQSQKTSPWCDLRPFPLLFLGRRGPARLKAPSGEL